MPLSKNELDELLRLIHLTEDGEINCEQCLALVAEFAETLRARLAAGARASDREKAYYEALVFQSEYACGPAELCVPRLVWVHTAPLWSGCDLLSGDDNSMVGAEWSVPINAPPDDYAWEFKCTQDCR